MKIVTIDVQNINILETFIDHITSPFFRYYTSRTPHNAIKDHIYTIVGLVDTVPVAYGHIDKENDTYWIGVCVLDSHTRRGFGQQILVSLLTRADALGISVLELTVDVDNIPAQNLYKKHGFVINHTTSTHTRFHMKRPKPPMQTTSIVLPVSYGEALDKLTILDIKMSKIKDTRRNDVEKEYYAIYSLIAPLMIPDVCYHYNTLKHTNLSIWDMQDTFRESSDVNLKNTLCNTIILDNDRRFRIKHKINALLNSSLKEQKGYAPRNAFVLTHLGLGDMITTIGLVRYLSTSYDSVTVLCKASNANNVAMFYSDDSTIKLHIQPNDNYTIDYPREYDNYTMIALGDFAHMVGKTSNTFNYLPYNFYADAGIPPAVFWTYFHTATQPESMVLYRSLPHGTPYIIIHSHTSTGPVFTAEHVENDFNIDRNTTLILDVNINIYSPDHPFYDIAGRFVNMPLTHYKDTIINASYVIVVDSSFYCFAMQLPIKTPHCYVISRDGRDYSYMYSPEFGFDPTSGKQQFKQLYV